MTTGLSNLDESDLVRRAQQGDQDAFQELMRRSASTSLRLALSIVKNRQEAEDQVQNSFFKAWKRLGTFQFESKFSTWLRTIVMNQSLMHLRSARRANIQSLDEPGDATGRTFEPPDQGVDPESSLSGREISVHLRREVQRLPAILRDVIILRDLEQLPTEEVAARLGISEPAAKSRLSRARQLLKQRMERHMSRTYLIA